MCGAFAHGSIFLVRDTAVVGTVIGWMLAYRAGLVSLLSVLCLFSAIALGHQFSDQGIVLVPV